MFVHGKNIARAGQSDRLLLRLFVALATIVEQPKKKVHSFLFSMLCMRLVAIIMSMAVQEQEQEQ